MRAQRPLLPGWFRLLPAPPYDPDTDIAFGYIDYAEDYEWVLLFLREVETHRVPLSLDFGDGRIRTIKHGPRVECDLYWEPKDLR